MEKDGVMRLELSNVGKLNSVDIELNGITVVAGENNTGKSTIGKMLYCIFHSFYKIEDQIKDEQVKSISRILNTFYIENSRPIFGGKDVRPLALQLVENKSILIQDRNRLIREIKYFFNIENKGNFKYSTEEDIEKIAKRISGFFGFEDREIQEILLRKRLNAEFAMKIGHLNNTNQKTTVKLHIKNEEIFFEVDGNEEIQILDYMDLNKEIIYIDDPFILDELNQFRYNVFSDSYGHRQDLLEKLSNDKMAEDFSVVDELVVQKRIEKILGKMQGICDGDIVEENGEFVFKNTLLNGNLKMVNLSTGLKSFAILKRLLRTGKIDENGIIILDEPEIHLHPEWQLKFAEIIILLQKEFKLNILLNTHSPYFLNAIEAYAKKYNRKDICKFYLSDEKDGNTKIFDVTNETEKIYAKLAKPLQELENLEYGDTII